MPRARTSLRTTSDLDTLSYSRLISLRRKYTQEISSRTEFYYDYIKPDEEQSIIIDAAKLEYVKKTEKIMRAFDLIQKEINKRLEVQEKKKLYEKKLFLEHYDFYFNNKG